MGRLSSSCQPRVPPTFASAWAATAPAVRKASRSTSARCPSPARMMRPASSVKCTVSASARSPRTSPVAMSSLIRPLSLPTSSGWASAIASVSSSVWPGAISMGTPIARRCYLDSREVPTPRSDRMAQTVQEFFQTLESRADSSKTAGMTNSYVFEIEGAGEWKVDVDDGKVTVTEGGGDADAVISASEETFEKIVAGEQTPTSAYMTGKLKVKGDMGAAMKLQKLF